MSKVFFPRVFVLVEASRPHPDNTHYKVAIGPEDWGNGVFAEVVKVQMVYNGTVSGRQAPSYPLNTTDRRIVTGAIERLEAGQSADEVQAWVNGQQLFNDD